MAGGIRARIQDSDNGDAVVGRLKIYHRLLDAAPSIARPNVGAALRLMRRFGRIGACGFDKIGVAKGLGQTLLRNGILKHPVKIALRPWTEPVFSHAELFCAA